QAADRFNSGKSFEAIQNKWIGTGHSDTTKYEWVTNHHRDSVASHVGHSDLLAFFAVAENASIGRVRYNLLEKMLQPCGPPPPKEDDEEEDG
ncbi:unnamed protein product, partial [Phaeothamnion confervicola]